MSAPAKKSAPARRALPVDIDKSVAAIQAHIMQLADTDAKETLAEYDTGEINVSNLRAELFSIELRMRRKINSLRAAIYN